MATSTRQASLFNPLFPLYLISSSDLLSLDRFITHEEAQRKGYLVRAKEIIKFRNYALTKSSDSSTIDDGTCREHCAFISHRWIGNCFPDSENSQLKQLQVLVQKKVMIKYWWFDYLCIPQEDRTFQPLAIASLPNYVRSCGHFFSPC